MDSISEIQATCLEDSERWFPGVVNISHHALSLAGEVGEFCNIVKKVERGDVPHPEADPEVKMALALELTDILIYLANIAQIMGIDLGKSYDVKRAFNEERFGPSNSIKQARGPERNGNGSDE